MASSTRSTPTPPSTPSASIGAGDACAPLKSAIEEQMEYQHFLDQLVKMNKDSIAALKGSTHHKFELLIKFLFGLLAEEDERLEQVMTDMKEILRMEFGPKEPSAATSTSARPVSSWLGFFTGGSTNEGDSEAEEADTEDGGSGKDWSTKVAPGYTLLALLVKEVKQMNSRSGSLADTLGTLQITQAALLDEQKTATSFAKAQYAVAKEALDVEKEKLQLLKKLVSRSGVGGGKGDANDGAGCGALFATL